MRKKAVTSVIVGMVLLMTACSSGNEKSTFSEKDLETISEKQAEEAIMKVAEQEEKKYAESKGKVEKENVSLNPHEPDLKMEGIDPYEENLFEIFGLDNDFPKPKDTFEQKWVYATKGFKMDEQTGDIRAGVQKYELGLRIEPKMYADYENEVIEYLKGKFDIYTEKTDEYRGEWLAVLEDGSTLTFGTMCDVAYSFSMIHISLNKMDQYSVTGEIVRISEHDIALDPEKTYIPGIYIKTENGEEVEINKTLMSNFNTSHSKPDYAFFELEHYPEVGNKIKIDYLERAGYNTGHKWLAKKSPNDTNEWPVVITNIEYVN